MKRRFQNFNEAKAFLYSRLPMFERQGIKGYKPGLERIQALCSCLNHPEKKVPFIHVGGTNGKGSTSTFLALQLQKHHSKVGLFISPHLIEVNERIQINFQPIAFELITDFLNCYWSHIEAIQPSYFELMTAIGFWYFAMEQCDIAVIEVGMGGRLDSTNIITPELSIITTVDYDHQAYLGNSLESIAREKSGIIKPNRPALVGHISAHLFPIFEAKASEVNSPLFFIQDFPSIQQEAILSPLKARYQFVSGTPFFFSDVIATYQAKNFTLAYAGLQLLGLEPDLSLWEQTKYVGALRGRMEPISHDPLIFYDIAHNCQGIQALLHTIHQLGDPPLAVLFACSQDKDWTEMVSLFPPTTQWIVTSSQSPRSLPPAIIGSHLSQSFSHVQVVEEPEKSYFALKNSVNRSRIGIITGTAFLYEKLFPFFSPPYSSSSNLAQGLQKLKEKP